MACGIIKLNPDTSKYEIWHEGKMIGDGKARYHLTEKVKRGVYREYGVDRVVDEKVARNLIEHPDGTAVGDGAVDSTVEAFSVTERFDFIRNVVQAVGQKSLNSAVILGEGGLGKSHTVTEGLHAAGLVDYHSVISPEVAGEFAVPSNVYIPIKGFSTARALYELLYKYNGRTLVFDDCDRVLMDPDSAMMFKGALDSNQHRWIDWRSSSPFTGDEIPKSFEFIGNVIFISNRRMSQIDQALRSRSVCIDISMTREQKLERMAFIADKPDFMEGYARSHVAQAFDVIQELAPDIGDLNLRTLIKAVQIRATLPDWKNVVRFVSVTN